MNDFLVALLERAAGKDVPIPESKAGQELCNEPVSPEGPLDAKIVVVGDFLSWEEEEQRHNFVGNAGKKLRNHMRLAGVFPEKCRFLKVYPFYPFSDSVKNVEPALLQQWKIECLKEVEKCTNAKVIACVGNLALSTLMGVEDITRRRGSVYVRKGKKVVGIIPPALVHRRAEFEKYCRLDWERIKLLSTAHETHHEYCGCAVRQARTHITPYSEKGLFSNTIERYIKSAQDSQKVLAIDIETPKVQGKRQMVCVSFAFTPNESLVLPWGTELDWAVKKLCESPCIKLGHNFVSFDRWWLRRVGIEVQGEIRDSLCLHHCLDPASSHSLEYLTSILTWEPWYKDEGKGHDITLIDADREGYFSYCGLDSCTTKEIHDRLWPELERQGRVDFYRKHYEALYDPILDLMSEGVRIDHDKRKTLLTELLGEARSARDRLGTLNGEPLFTLGTRRDAHVFECLQSAADPLAQLVPQFYTTEQVEKSLAVIAGKSVSNAQLKKLLYDKLGLPLQTKRRQGGDETATADAVALRRLRLAHTDREDVCEVIDLAMNHNKAQKLASFLYPTTFDEDGVFRFTLKLNTEASRLASSKAPNGTGQNSQNLPREVKFGRRTVNVRSVFLPESGHVILEGDACLVGDTKIETPYGSIPIAQINTGDLVFSWRDSRVVIGEVTAKKYIGDFPVMRLVLDNGEEIIGTAEHKFPIRRQRGNGRGPWRGVPNMYIEEVQLQDLRPGDSLLPLRKAIDTNGREIVYSRSAFEYTRTHTAVAEFVYGVRPEGCDVHHIDGDYLNNHPFNLMYKDSFIHKSEHAQAAWENTTGVKKEEWLRRVQSMVQCRTHDYNGSGNPRYGYRKGEDRLCVICGVVFHKKPSHNQVFCSQKCYFASRRGVLRALTGVHLTCLVCGTDFYAYPSDIKRRKKFCSSTCASKSRVLNHKVVSVETLTCTQPVYSITVEPDHNYALSAGVFTKNSQIEGRIVFVRTGDPELIKLGRLRSSDFDQHKYVASMVFKKPLDQIGAKSPERQIAKSTNHAAMRDMQGKTMADQLLRAGGYHEDGTAYTTEECDALIEAYHQAFPGIRLWQQKIRQEVRSKKKLTNRWGRVWDVRYEELSGELFRRSYNFLPQSECAEITNQLGFIALWRWLKKHKMHSRILFQEHDALVCSCALDEVYDVAQFLKGSIEVELDYDGVGLTVPMEWCIGKNWGEKIEWKELPSRKEVETVAANLLSK